MMCLYIGKEVSEGMEEAFKKQDLSVLEYQLTKELGDLATRGKLRNDKEFVLDLVLVKAKCYGTVNTVLGESSDYRGAQLEPGEVWEFEVKGYRIDADEVSDHKLTA